MVVAVTATARPLPATGRPHQVPHTLPGPVVTGARGLHVSATIETLSTESPGLRQRSSNKNSNVVS